MASFVPLIVLAVFIGFALAIMWRPSVVVAMALCVYSFEQWAQANHAFFGTHSTCINLGFGLLTVWALGCTIAKGKNPLKITPLAFWSWLALYLFAGISCLWSVDRDISIFLYRYHMPYEITFILLLPFIIQDKSDLRAGLFATLIFGLFVMTMLLVSTKNHSWGRTIEVAQGATVVDSVGNQKTRLGPLAIAEMCGQIMLIAVLMNFTGVGKFLRLARWPIAFLAFALIWRSGSRGQLIAAMLAVFMYLPFSRGITRISGWVTTCVSAVLIVGFAAWSFAGFAESSERWSISEMQESFSGTRLKMATDLFAFWSTSSPINWMFGLGSSASYDTRIVGTYCHMVFIEVLCELGIVGFLLFVAFVFLGFFNAYKLYKLTHDSPVERGLAVTLAGMFTFQMILTFKQGSLLTHTFTFCCGILIARHLVLMQLAQKREQQVAWYRWWYSYQQRLAETAKSMTGLPSS